MDRTIQLRPITTGPAPTNSDSTSSSSDEGLFMGSRKKAAEGERKEADRPVIKETPIRPSTPSTIASHQTSYQPTDDSPEFVRSMKLPDPFTEDVEDGGDDDGGRVYIGQAHLDRKNNNKSKGVPKDVTETSGRGEGTTETEQATATGKAATETNAMTSGDRETGWEVGQRLGSKLV